MVATVEPPLAVPHGVNAFARSTARIADVVAAFDPISLAEMERVSLLNRTDTKYVMGVSQLQRALAQIRDQYRVLEVNGTRLNHYQTLYFDTPDFALYRQLMLYWIHWV